MLRRFVLMLCLAGLGLPVQAIDYRSVEPGAAVLYDTPSQKGKKLYLIRAGTPVEVVVRLGEWSKVRDAEGTLAWLENRDLSDKRMLAVVTPRAEIRKTDQLEAPVVLELEKWVGLEYLESASPGWVKVRHAGGVVGFVRAQQVWGL